MGHGVYCVVVGQETDTLTRTLAQLQSELRLLLDDAQISHIELQNMVEQLGRQHRRLQNHLHESKTILRTPAKSSYRRFFS